MGGRIFRGRNGGRTVFLREPRGRRGRARENGMLNLCGTFEEREREREFEEVKKVRRPYIKGIRFG